MLKGLLLALITLMLPACSEPKSESPESVVQAFISNIFGPLRILTPQMLSALQWLITHR